MSPNYDAQEAGNEPLPLPSGAGPPRWSMLLRALRSARGITQEGWAARIGVSRKTVQRWESGDVLPDARAESALLAACNELSLFLPRAAGTDERAFLPHVKIRCPGVYPSSARKRQRTAVASHHVRAAQKRSHIMAGQTVIYGHHQVDHMADRAGDHVQQHATAHFVVTYNRGLGAAGQAAAQLIADHCEQDYGTLQTYFGGITPANLPFHIRVTAGSTGASHATCLDTALQIGARSAPANDQQFLNALVVAEEDEVFMANYGHGWDCGASNGEGLSRVLSNELYPGAEPQGFVSAPVWLSQGRPDFINTTDPSDVNYPSIGCAVLFLNWLHTQLGHGWTAIIAAGGPTLADVYRNLGEAGDGWTRFRTLIDAHFPPGQPVTLASDNPFPLQ